MKSKLTFILILILITVFTSCFHTDCSKDTQAYEDGYNFGETCRITGAGNNYDAYVDGVNESMHKIEFVKSDCLYEGYEDGYYQKQNRYESSGSKEDEKKVSENETKSNEIKATPEVSKPTVASTTPVVPPNNSDVSSNNSDVSSNNDVVKTYNIISNYYSDIKDKSFNAAKYYNESVVQFISYKNISCNEIQQRINESYGEFVNSKAIVDRGSFTFIRNTNGIKYFQYSLHFTCYRKSLAKGEECDVLIEIGVNDIFRLISYNELKVSNLKWNK
jgi:hypothetical protein